MKDIQFPIPEGYEWQYHLLAWLQTFVSPHVAKILMYVTLLGVEKFYLILLPVLFWSFSRTIGLRIAYVFLTSMFVNTWLKDIILETRPIGIPGIRAYYIETATGYSMPSGHAQGPATLWLIMYRWLRKGWVLFLALLLIFAIGTSRLALGLHWPLDVLFGWGLGLAIGFIGWSIGKWWTYRAYDFSIRLMFAIVVPVIFLLISSGLASSEYAVILLGVGVGALLEEKYLKTSMCPQIWKRFCVALIGVGGLIAIQYGVTALSEATPVLFIRDALIGVWGTIGAPYIFSLCGLYNREE